MADFLGCVYFASGNTTDPNVIAFLPVTDLALAEDVIITFNDDADDISRMTLTVLYGGTSTIVYDTLRGGQLSGYTVVETIATGDTPDTHTLTVTPAVAWPGVTPSSTFTVVATVTDGSGNTDTDSNVYTVLVPLVCEYPPNMQPWTGCEPPEVV